MSIIKKNYHLIIILFLCFWAVRSLLFPGFFSMHDDEQVGRLYDLDQALRAWHIPPRIAPNLGFGYGYPFFNFYPPFAYYVAEIFKLAGFSYIASTKLMVGLGFVLGAFFMYLLSKEFFGKLGGLISAVFYTYAPYHAVDVYVRGAFPEFWSMVFLPAIFWTFYKLRRDYEWRFFIFSIIFMSSLILTHNLVVVMAGPFLFLWIAFLTLIGKNRKRFLLICLSSILLAFLTTSYFWMPSFFERKYTMVGLLTTELANYGQHFLYIRQFWNSVWGYGGSIYGLHDGLSFEIGKIHLILSLSAFFIAAKFITSKTTRAIGISIFIFIILLLFSIFMASFHSRFIWDRVEFLWYIQFPWRFLIFSTVFSSLLAGSISLLPLNNKLKTLFAVIALTILIGSNAKYFVPARFLSSAKDLDYINQEKIRWDTSILAWEYVPKGVATTKSNIDTTVIDITKKDIAKSSFKVVSGDMRVRQIQDSPQEKKYKVVSDKAGVLRINTYSFPGWKVYVDGNESSYTDNNRLKLITLPPLVGSHTVTAKFTDTKVRFLGNWISLASIFSLIILILFNIIKSLVLKKNS